MSVAIALYRTATNLGGPVIDTLLHRRIAAGREDPDRIGERRGIASRARPDGDLIWIHAASVGEANSCLRVIERLLRDPVKRSVLLTTGTVTSAKMVESRLPDGAIHQYYPVDRGLWVRRFLDHWRPDAAIWVESELWPNMICEASKRAIPLALINARMSERSERNWRLGGSAVRHLLSRFSVCLAQTPQEADCFKRLGADNAVYVGNLKYSAVPPPADKEDLSALQAAVADRPVWLAASTHPGDEALALDVHRRLSADYSGLLTVIALRHPNRFEEVASLVTGAGLSFSSRNRDGKPSPDAGVFIVDTVGEMGLFYRLCPIVLVCGTFSGLGGHNPIEPAMLDCAILHGPDMRNFAAVAEDLEKAQASLVVRDSEETAKAVSALLAHPEQGRSMATAARQVAAANENVIERVMSHIDKMIAEQR
ncbi:MAG: 3-deoxy-D-manno-octulosonic acid transferase [Alphaproteobacteria bacterium]